MERIHQLLNSFLNGKNNFSKMWSKFILTILSIVLMSCQRDKQREQTFYSDGVLKHEVIFLDGGDSTSIEYNVNGDTIEKRLYYSGSFKEQWKYYNNHPFIRRIFHSENRVKETSFHNNGRVDCEYELIDGKKEGVEECYFEGGGKRTKAHYVDGEPMGEFRQYHPNGEIYISTDSIGNGKTFVYDSLGNLIDELKYENFELMK